MRRLIILLLLLLLTAGVGEAVNKAWWATGPTGGSDNLDGVDGNDLTAGDMGFSLSSSYMLFYRLTSTECNSADDSSTPAQFFKPDANGTDKCWRAPLIQPLAGVAIANGAAGAGFLRLLEDSDNGTDYVSVTGSADSGTTAQVIVAGSATNENLILQVGATDSNAVTVTTSTGVSSITFQGSNAQDALALATTGTVKGAITVIDMGTDATYTLAAANAYGSILLMTDSDSVTTVALPDYQATAATDHVKVGASVCVLNLQAQATIVDPSADDKIRTSNGTLNGAGVSVTGPATVGAYSCFVLTDTSSDVGHWTQMGLSGAWPVTP
jgi:hypothetical protein